MLKTALDEVVEVFADAPYIHIGGDEVSTTAAYLNEMIAHVESKGKKAGIWNPINGIGQDALDASLVQMWGTRGIVAPGKANIDCRYNYTNHFDVFADLVGIYKSTIYYKEKGDGFHTSERLFRRGPILLHPEAAQTGAEKLRKIIFS